MEKPGRERQQRSGQASSSIAARGAMKGPMVMGGREIPPTGKSFEVDFYTIGRWHDGQIVEENLMYDLVGFLQQIGLSEQVAARGPTLHRASASAGIQRHRARRRTVGAQRAAQTCVGAGRRSARLATPPRTPAASAIQITLGVQAQWRPRRASSE